MTPDRPTGPSPGGAPGETVQLCSFRVGEERYVIDIMRIREIVSPLPVTPVRRTSPLVEGVVDLRGQVIPLVDLRLALGVDDRTVGREAKHVIAAVADGLVALVVDAMGRVLTVPRGAIQLAPALLGNGDASVFPGVLNQGGALYLLLDVETLLEGGAPAPEAVTRMRDAVLGGAR